jgi:hypothetical protein
MRLCGAAVSELAGCRALAHLWERHVGCWIATRAWMC